MAAGTMGKPSKEILERGFTKDDALGEHEGVAEILGESASRRDAAARAVSRAIDAAIGADADVDSAKAMSTQPMPLDANAETEDEAHVKSVKLEVFPALSRIGRFVGTIASTLIGIPIKVDAIVPTKRPIRDKAGKTSSFTDFTCASSSVSALASSGIG